MSQPNAFVGDEEDNKKPSLPRWVPVTMVSSSGALQSTTPRSSRHVSAAHVDDGRNRGASCLTSETPEIVSEADVQVAEGRASTASDVHGVAS